MLFLFVCDEAIVAILERIPNLTGEQSDGITVFRIPPMTSLMLHRCRTGAINLQRWWQSPSAAISESDWFLYRTGISRRITSCTVVSWRRHDSHRSFQQFCFLFRCNVTSLMPPDRTYFQTVHIPATTGVTVRIVRKNSPQYMFRNSSHSCHYRRYRTVRIVTLTVPIALKIGLGRLLDKHHFCIRIAPPTLTAPTPPFCNPATLTAPTPTRTPPTRLPFPIAATLTAHPTRTAPNSLLPVRTAANLTAPTPIRTPPTRPPFPIAATLTAPPTRTVPTSLLPVRTAANFTPPTPTRPPFPIAATLTAPPTRTAPTSLLPVRIAAPTSLPPVRTAGNLTAPTPIWTPPTRLPFPIAATLTAPPTRTVPTSLLPVRTAANLAARTPTRPHFPITATLTAHPTRTAPISLPPVRTAGNLTAPTPTRLPFPIAATLTAHPTRTAPTSLLPVRTAGNFTAPTPIRTPPTRPPFPIAATLTAPPTRTALLLFFPFVLLNTPILCMFMVCAMEVPCVPSLNMIDAFRTEGYHIEEYLLSMGLDERFGIAKERGNERGANRPYFGYGIKTATCNSPE
ncbi:hypothetical protein ANN_22512 [Periplaneta americana]|uniref:Uncharacterized protein n=1 Tax=Periplaneta americana TaxID=6978 RepID=A0ABQ8S8C6_PERAM|nr:hypothetical protein ANN_22512 [Periplaneta americana]